MPKLHIPDTISLGALKQFANDQGCLLGQDELGDYYLTQPVQPVDHEPPHQGNANVVKFPRRKNQLHGEPGNTTPPDIA